MKRTVENSHTDARYRADIILPTGKTITLTSDWKPSHWDEVLMRRAQLIQDARERAGRVRDVYGITCDSIRIVCEKRRTDRVVETTVSEKLHSELFLVAEVSS